MKITYSQKKRLEYKKEYEGKTFVNKDNQSYVVVEYINANKVLVRFEEDGYECWTFLHNMKKGILRNPNFRSVYNIGYIGVGEYKSSINGKLTKTYKTWFKMFERCYSEQYLSKYPTYENKQVCEEWHNFQNFAKWYEENYYEVEGEVVCLDKDILVKGNTIYSPQTCVFVPNKINTLVVTCQGNRGELPIGVSMNGKKFRSCINYNRKTTHLGLFDTKEEAFEVYKKAKEELIRATAEQYKSRIPEKLYVALLNYKVEITD